MDPATRREVLLAGTVSAMVGLSGCASLSDGGGDGSGAETTDRESTTETTTTRSTATTTSEESDDRTEETPGSPDVRVETARLETPRVLVPGDTLEVRVTLVNEGGADGVEEVSLVLDGEVAASERVEVPSGDAVTVSLSMRVESTRTYSVEVGGRELPSVRVRPAITGDWPQYQYDDHNTSYKPDGSVVGRSLSKLWETKTPGGVESAPCVGGGTVYAHDRSGDLYALDAVSGTEQWRTTMGGEIAHPTIADGTVYVAGEGRLFAFDAESGSERWASREVDAWDSDPLVVDDGVVYTVGDRISAVNAADGAVLWKRDASQFLVTSDWIYAVVPGDGYRENLVRLDKRRGSVQWSTELGKRTFHGPSYSRGILYLTRTVAGPDDDRGTFEVLAVDEADGSVVWERRVDEFDLASGDNVFIPTSPSVTGTRVYCGWSQVDPVKNGRLFALDARTGEELYRYSVRPRDGPSVVGDSLFVVGRESNRLFLLNAASLSPVTSRSLPGPVRYTPAVAGGVAFVGVKGHGVVALETT